MMDTEQKISRLLLNFSKFEFFVVGRDIKLAKTENIANFNKISGLDWNKLGLAIETKFPFSTFRFTDCEFSALKDTPPQFLVVEENGRVKWDSDGVEIDSWVKLLTRGLAQVRNNIAHGNKALSPSQFTHGRTEIFIEASFELINFIAEKVLDYPSWEEPILFS